MTDSKAQVRAWLYQLLAKLETTEIVGATKTEQGTHVDIQIEFD